MGSQKHGEETEDLNSEGGVGVGRKRKEPKSIRHACCRGAGNWITERLYLLYVLTR